jgi:hypothetical protein
MKMDFPRKVVLHLVPRVGEKKGKVVAFGPGVQDVPEEFVEHPHLKRAGAKVVKVVEITTTSDNSTSTEVEKQEA